jgi:hypothetical protein
MEPLPKRRIIARRVPSNGGKKAIHKLRLVLAPRNAGNGGLRDLTRNPMAPQPGDQDGRPLVLPDQARFNPELGEALIVHEIISGESVDHDRCVPVVEAALLEFQQELRARLFPESDDPKGRALRPEAFARSPKGKLFLPGKILPKDRKIGSGENRIEIGASE